MYPSTNTRYNPISPIETIDIVPHIPPITPYLIISDPDDTIKYIQTIIKAFNKNIDTDMNDMNDHIASTLATLIDTGVKTNNQYDKSTEISSKLSTFEYCQEKIINKKHSCSPWNYRSNKTKMRELQSFHPNYQLMKTTSRN